MVIIQNDRSAKRAHALVSSVDLRYGVCVCLFVFVWSSLCIFDTHAQPLLIKGVRAVVCVYPPDEGPSRLTQFRCVPCVMHTE